MRFLFTLIILVTSLCGFAQTPNAPAQRDSLEVSLITCYPGPDIFEIYGHSAIRVKQSDKFDIAFNYGIFDFSEPNFVLRFCLGSAKYILAYYDFDRFLDSYRERGSKVVEQKLNLSQETCYKLVNSLFLNAEPQNRAYRYNYIYDNCSTRPRDMIEMAVGPSLKYPAPQDSTLSFRDIMHQYNSNYKWEKFGIELALGTKLDKTLTLREQFFAPVYLEKALNKTTYAVNDSIVVPLVSQKNILVNGSDEGVILPATPFFLSPIFFAVLLLLLTIGITVFDIKNGKLSKGFDTVFYFIAGVSGCIIFFLVFISDNAATSPNLTALWLNPYYFIPMILIWIKRSRRFLYYCQIINFALLIVMLAGGWLMPQQFDAAIYPIIAALALRHFNYIYNIKKCATPAI